MISGPRTRAAPGTREQILRVGRELVQKRSYLGFSFQDVADAVGVRKASLYHHFPSKEALGIEVLGEAAQAFRDWTLRRSGSPQAMLEAYFRMYREGIRAGEAMCPAGAFAPGWDCIQGELQEAVRELRSAQVLWLTGVLGAAGSGASAAERAAWVFATCQGALLAARMTGRVQTFDEVVTQLKQALAH